MAESILQLWTKKCDTIPATSVKVVDRVALSSFTRLEYIVEMRDTTSNKTKGFKFSVQNDETDLSDVLTAKVGNEINIEIYAKVNGSDCEIELTNNESFDLAVSFARLKL